MKLLVLTTKTQHHDFFNNNIYKKYPNLDVIYEEKKPKFSFEINNKSIKLRDKYEKIYFKNKYYKNNIKKHYVKSINLFKKNANIALRHYSYPEGQKKDFNKKIKSILKEFGIICCPSEINGFNNSKTNLFDLKRIQVI